MTKWPPTWLSGDRVNLAGLGGLLGLTILAGVALFGPLLGNRHASGSGRRELSRDQQTLQDQRAGARRLRQALTRTRGELSATRVPLLPAGRINARVAELTDLAARQGLTVNRIQPGASSFDGLHERVPILLAARGTYPTGAGFIRTLRQELPDVAVEAFELKRADHDGKAQAELRVELMWFAAAESGPATTER